MIGRSSEVEIDSAHAARHADMRVRLPLPDEIHGWAAQAEIASASLGRLLPRPEEVHAREHALPYVHIDAGAKGKQRVVVKRGGEIGVKRAEFRTIRAPSHTPQAHVVLLVAAYRPARFEGSANPRAEQSILLDLNSD